jgi:Tfp pilus assembly PilM family ATPase
LQRDSLPLAVATIRKTVTAAVAFLNAQGGNAGLMDVEEYARQDAVRTTIATSIREDVSLDAPRFAARIGSVEMTDAAALVGNASQTGSA